MLPLPPRNRVFILTAILSTATLCGCAKKALMAPPPPPPPLPESILDQGEPQSLFRGDQAVLSDQDIARILGTKVDLSDRHHMAVLSLSTVNSWSEDLDQIETKNLDALQQALRSSPQLTDVRFLPSMLVPEKRTVPFLREAAARVQADLLFVYSSRIQSFQRSRFLKSDEVRAQCIAESVLLDVRTGIVVHTGHATENISAQKAPSDLNFNETVARAESQARGKALLSLANGVTAFLASSK